MFTQHPDGSVSILNEDNTFSVQCSSNRPIEHKIIPVENAFYFRISSVEKSGNCTSLNTITLSWANTDLSVRKAADGTVIQCTVPGIDAKTTTINVLCMYSYILRSWCT